MKKRFHQLGESMAQAYQDRKFQELQKLALEYLKLATQYKSDWNYGNAIHQANIYMGLMALEKNNIDEASSFLIKAGQTPGSPQLNNFGPNMLLAKKLLEKGERNSVLIYIDQCKNFWRLLFRMGRIKKWKKKIKQGEIPDFRAHLFYHLRYPAKATKDES